MLVEAKTRGVRKRQITNRQQSNGCGGKAQRLIRTIPTRAFALSERFKDPEAGSFTQGAMAEAQRPCLSSLHARPLRQLFVKFWQKDDAVLIAA